MYLHGLFVKCDCYAEFLICYDMKDLTADFGEVKTLPTFTIVKHLNVDDSSKKEVR